MSVPQTFNGVSYPIPTQGDLKWGPPLTRYLVALGSFALSTGGGVFTLTADIDFGSSFGLLAPYYKSKSANIASAGVLRLSNTDLVEWRNFANGGNNTLGVNVSDQLVYNGSALEIASLSNSHIFVGNAGNVPTDVAMSGDTTISNTGAVTIGAGAVTNAKIAASTGITLTKLAALNTAIVPVTDGSGFLTSSSTTTTEIGYVHGVTSAIQTQLNTLTSNQANYLLLTGGTLSGILAMGNNKITGLAAASINGDALSWGAALNGTTLTLSGLLSGSTLTLTGQATFANGTAAAPSISLVNSTATGLYRSAANELSISNSGVQTAKFTADNRLGIGGTPSVGNFNETLAVHRSGAGNVVNSSVDIAVQNDSTGTARVVVEGGPGAGDPASYLAAAQAGQTGGALWSGGPDRAASNYLQMQNGANVMIFGTNDSGPWWFRSESATAAWHYIASTTEVFKIAATGFFPYQASADPGSPSEGQVYYNTTAHTLKYYNGSTWKTIATV